ncbi:MAG: NAD+ synthase [Bifidobacteriaceae bacterium]|jgi:NAD+ synthase (glutamine-hydrolysing)|nr:NAD+ synthase [Bifidobacteriaceae bacterium]
MKIALAQINTTVGDLRSNRESIFAYCEKASDAGAQIIVFPEMSVSGYPIKDLSFSKDFLESCYASLQKIASQTKKGKPFEKLQIVLGLPTFSKMHKPHNSLAIVERGKIAYIYNKQQLPNFDEFSEVRNFTAGQGFSVHYSISDNITFNYAPLICEDIWDGPDGENIIDETVLPIFELADIAIVINSSPFNDRKKSLRDAAVSAFAHKIKKDVIYVNQVGGEDDLVFDGSSFVINKQGFKVQQAKSFTEDFVVYDTEVSYKPVRLGVDNIADIYKACVLSIYDYVRKSGFERVCIGASGGIDSSLVAVMAVDALGAENVKLVSMPSAVSSKESVTDAEELAKKLKTDFEIIPINKYVDDFQNDLQLESTAAENVQSRIRGLILMGVSNREGSLVLAPGNKSELAVGYSTLYGDTVGAYAPVKDVYKTDIIKLAKWRNSKSTALTKNPIPANVFVKEPSAELKPNQKDSDSLLDYSVLDKLLKLLIEKGESVTTIIERGFKKADVLKIAKLYNTSEYKRRQYPPGPKLTSKSFGPDRRIPLHYSYTK